MSATFDTGMLIALDRNERQAWVLLRRLLDRGEVPTVPAVVTAQAWRDGRRQVHLARVLTNCRPEDIDDDLARRAGELCARSATSDVVDAIVIQSAASRGDEVYTSDVGDLARLADHASRPVALVPSGR